MNYLYELDVSGDYSPKVVCDSNMVTVNVDGKRFGDSKEFFVGSNYTTLSCRALDGGENQTTFEFDLNECNPEVTEVNIYFLLLKKVTI